MNKNVYIKGKARYLRPYFLDTGENLDPDSDLKAKLDKTGGVYSTMVVLPFDNRDDAEEYLNGLGIPTDGMMGNLLKKLTDDDGNKEIVYKVVRPHLEPNFEDPLLGPPKVVKVVDDSIQEWDPEVLIGNGSDITIKVNVWIGNKAKKIRWESVRVDNLVEYVTPEGAF